MRLKENVALSFLLVCRYLDYKQNGHTPRRLLLLVLTHLELFLIQQQAKLQKDCMKLPVLCNFSLNQLQEQSFKCTTSQMNKRSGYSKVILDAHPGEGDCSRVHGQNYFNYFSYIRNPQTSLMEQSF